MTKLLTSLAVAICILAIAGIAFFANPSPAMADAAELGSDAPGFTLKDVKTGNEVSLSDYEGKTVVLVFHSVSCPWFEMRENAGYDRILGPMAEKYADKDVVFLGINANKTEPVEEIAAYVDKHKSPYTVLKDAGNVVADAYGAKVTPHIFVISAQGKLVYRGAIEKHVRHPGACGTSDTPYLVPVLDALLNDSELPYTDTSNEVRGCGIQRV